MAATATARSTATARRVAARRQAAGRAASPNRRRGQTPVVGFVPVAVGRTAGAVGGLADSGLVVRLTRSRLWIGLLGGLLVGIVALNVMALSFSASSSNAASQADELERLNSALRGDIATRLSNAEIQAEASKLGLIVPEPGAVSYVRASPGDAAEAARRLRAGELSGYGYVAPAEPTSLAPVAPTESVPATDPVPVVPEATTPVVAPESVAPAPAATPAAPVGGGIASP